MNPDHIEQRDFFVGLRGYDRDEVDAFLSEVAAEHRALLEEVHSLRNRALPAPPAAAPDPIADVGTQVSAILRTATEQAEEIKSQAHQQAAEVTVRAKDEAERVVHEAQEHATQLRQEAADYADHVRRESEDEAGQRRAEATQTLERAHEQAARIVSEAEARAEEITAAAEQRGRERALERADAEVARLGDAVRRYEELRARLTEASDELSLALIAMGDPAGDPFVNVRDVVLTDGAGSTESEPVTTHDH